MKQVNNDKKVSKAELLQLKLTPIICLMNFINKKVGNRKIKPTQYSNFKTDTVAQFEIAQIEVSVTYCGVFLPTIALKEVSTM